MQIRISFNLDYSKEEIAIIATAIRKFLESEGHRSDGGFSILYGYE